MLMRRLLNRNSSFASMAELEQRLANWIAYYNEHLAKSYQWKYDDKLLQVFLENVY